METAGKHGGGLDRLSSKERYDLAVSYAKRYPDARFFWELVELLPAAPAAVGELGCWCA